MRLLRLDIRNFRGFRSVTILPNEHVVLVGEPRAGRSTVVEALRRVFVPEASRLPLTDDLDFYRRDLSRTVEIEAVVGALGDSLEQDFFDQLEVWDVDTADVVLESPDPTAVDDEDAEFVVRFCYRARWNDDAEVGEHWVDFPKLSDPKADRYARMPRRLLETLPFVYVAPGERVLGLGVRSEFRALVDQSEGDDLAAAIEALLEQVESTAKAFSKTEQVSAALDAVIEPLRRPLQLRDRDGADAIQFLPEGGSLAGILRTLGPALQLDNGPALPLQRHGSTTSEMLRSAQALALAANGEAVVVVDDFGEHLDPATAIHLAATYRSTFEQAWLSTRRGAIAEVFHSKEIVRLIRPRKDRVRVYQPPVPKTRGDRVAARHLSVQLLPAISSRTLVVLEGPHDRLGLSAVAARRLLVEGEPLPSADGIQFADAGAADGSGGAGAAVKLAAYAARLGFRVVTVLDGDRAGDDNEDAAVEVSDAVVRLPTSVAIERALVNGLDEATVRGTVKDLATVFGLSIKGDIDSASGVPLLKIAADVMKSSGGLHAQFVELLPRRVLPPVASQVLETVRDCARGAKSGVVRL